MMRVAKKKKKKTPTYSWVRNLHDGSVCILAKVTMHEFVWMSTKEVAYTKHSIHNSPPKMQKVYNVESLLANELTNMVNIIFINTNPLKWFSNLIYFMNLSSGIMKKSQGVRLLHLGNIFLDIFFCDYRSGSHEWLIDKASVLNHCIILIIEFVESIFFLIFYN